MAPTQYGQWIVHVLDDMTQGDTVKGFLFWIEHIHTALPHVKAATARHRDSIWVEVHTYHVPA